MRRMLLAVVFLAGCQDPLNVRVYETVEVGDSTRVLTSNFGYPMKTIDLQTDPESEGWFYRERGVICGFIIQDDAVKHMECDASHYVSPGQIMGMALQGAGQGLQNASQRNVNCISQTSGDTTYTNCH